MWQIADQLKDRYGLDVHTIDPAAFGQQPELRAQTGISDRQLVHIDQLLQECSEPLYGDRDSVPPDRQSEIDQRLAEIEDLRGELGIELAARRSGPPPSVEAPTASERDRGGREQRDAQRTIATIGADLPLIGGYDTPERRQRLAERLTAVGVDAITVAAIASADVAQAHPAGDAPQATSSPSASPNRTRSRGPSQARQARRRP